MTVFRCKNFLNEVHITMKRILAMLLAVVALITAIVPLSGCGGKDEKEARGTYPVSVAGVTIEKRPEIITCLSVNYSKIIVDMGYASLLDGRPGDCELPQLQAAAPCGTAKTPSIDAIVNLGTELLIVDTTTSIETLQLLSDAGITILQLIEPNTRTGFLNLYRCIGTAMNGNGAGYDAGEAAAQNILTQLDSIERAIMFETPVNVCLFTDESLTKCVSGDMLSSYLIEIAGGFNVSIESVNGNSNMETIIASSPDVILCPPGVENKIRSQRDLDSCGAYNDNRIYGYDFSRFNSLDEDLVLAAWELAHLFHPSVVTSEKLPYGAIDYYPNFEGKIEFLTEEEVLAEQEALEALENEEKE